MKYIIIALLCFCSFTTIYSQEGMQWYESITGLYYPGHMSSMSIHGLKIHSDKSSTITYFSRDAYAHSYMNSGILDNIHFQPDYHVSVDHFSSNGTLVWNIKIINGFRLFSKKPFSKLTIDKNNNIVVIVQFTDFIAVGQDTMLTVNKRNQGLAAFRISLNGKILNKKILCEAQYIQPDAISIDSSNNLYFAGSFSDKISYWEGSTVRSKDSPSYFLASYNSDLSRNWVRTFRETWDKYGEINCMAYNPISDKVHLFIFSGNYTYSNRCNEEPWILNHRIWDKNGQQINSDTLAIFNNRMNVGDCAIDRYGNVMVVGSFNGEVQSGDNQITSYANFNSCNRLNSYLLKCNSIGKPLSLKLFKHNDLFNIHSIKTMPDGSYYLAGKIDYNQPSASWLGEPYPNGTNRAFVGKYDYWDNLLSYREFNKNNPSDYYLWDYLNMDVAFDGDILIADNHRGKYDTVAISPNTDGQTGSISLFLLSDKQVTPTDYIPKSGWTFGSLSAQNEEMTIYA